MIFLFFSLLLLFPERGGEFFFWGGERGGGIDHFGIPEMVLRHTWNKMIGG